MDITYIKIFYLSFVFLISVLAAYIISNSNSVSEINEKENYIPNYTYEEGKEFVFIYIGSPHCGFSNSSEMPAYIEKSKLKAKKIAEENDANFSTIGVAIGWSAMEGYEHLQKFGIFDEIMTGRSWFNIGAREFIYSDFSSNRNGIVPQIVLISRDITADDKNGQKMYSIANVLEIDRFHGLDEIAKFSVDNN